MGINNIKKRLIVTALALLGVIALLAGWLTHQANKPYQEVTISETKLYIPAEHLGPKPQGLIEMVRNYIQGQSPQIRVQLPISELLNNSHGSQHEDQRVIFTLEPSNETPMSNLLPLADANLLKMAMEGAGVLIEHQPDGLVKIYRDQNDKSAFSYSNLKADTKAIDTNIWLAHCIHFRALRADSSWGRCSRQIIQAPLKISIHFDGTLVQETANLTDAILAKVQKWQTTP